MLQWLKNLRQHLLTGVSYAIPFIACGGHLRLFSRLARNLMDEEFRNRLLSCGSQDELLSVLNTIEQAQSV